VRFKYFQPLHHLGSGFQIIVIELEVWTSAGHHPVMWTLRQMILALMLLVVLPWHAYGVAHTARSSVVVMPEVSVLIKRFLASTFDQL